MKARVFLPAQKRKGALMIEQALKHAKQAIELYGFSVDFRYKDTPDGYEAIAVIKNPETPEKDAGGYKSV